MRCIEVTQHGGPEVLELVEKPDPRPSSGQVVVRTEAVGINYIDTYLREGLYPSDPPFVPGFEGAGVVVECGDDVSTVQVGDKVAWCQVLGSYAELVCVPVDSLVVIPQKLDSHIAASALLQGMTAHFLVNDCHRATEGDAVFITAGAGGVGQLLIQMAVARGFTVITSTSTKKKAAICRDLGARHVLSYAEATAERIRSLSNGGVATVFDGVGRDTFDTSMSSLRPRGFLVLFGAASGPVPPVDPQRLNSAGSLFLTRPTLAHYIATEAEFQRRAHQVLDGLSSGSLNLSVGRTFGLAQAALAHSELQSRSTVGSITLDPTR